MNLKDSYLSKNGYVLRKEFNSKDQIDSLKLELRGRPLQDSKYNSYNQKDTTFPLYIETKNKLYIPKMYGIKNYGQPESTTSSYAGKSWDNDHEFVGNLYPLQINATGNLIDSLKLCGGGILSLQTGGGKTFCALFVLSKLKVKTLIIVNKVALLKQWESEIKTCLPSANVGIIQGQKNIQVQDADIVISMLQSLAKIDYPPSLFQDFGCVCIDETHNVSSPIFSKVLMKICCKYTIGLSATPNRSDGCEYIFKWFLGDIVYKSNLERKGLHPIVNMVKIQTNEYKEVAIENKVTGQKQIQFTSMLSDLVCLTKRNKLIIAFIKQSILENRKILVLSDRREHVKILKEMLDNDNQVTFTYGLFIGGMKFAQLEASKACQLILATFSAFGEGVSERDLDTLILVTPKKFIGHLKNSVKNESGKMEQYIGRIFRKEHTDKHPLIIDFNDDFSIYKSQTLQRKVFYKDHFPNVLLKEMFINLDDFDENDINYDSITVLKQSKKEQAPSINIYNQCLLD